MDQSKTRIFLLVGLAGLALGAPYLMSSSDDAAPAARQPSSAKPSAQPAMQAPRAEPADNALAAAALPKQELANIETDTFVAQVSSLNGGLTSFKPKAERYHSRGEPIDVVTTDRPEYLPLAVELKGEAPEAAAAGFRMQQLSPTAVALSREVAGLRVSRKVEAGQGPYQLWLTTHIENKSGATRKVQLQIPTHHYLARAAEGVKIPLLPVQSWAISRGVCRHGDDLERLDRQTAQEPHRFGAPIAFAGVENSYFLSAIAPDSNSVESCRVEATDRGRDADNEPLGTLFSTRITHSSLELAPGASKTYRTLAYLGPKSPEELSAAGHSLSGAIERGWFTSLAEGLTWLLRKIHDGIGNWGVAIILLTVLVKTVLFPLTARQMASMAKMKELKPELDRINELYGNDREKKGAAIMELYRKRGINPMAGCFPVLLQLPIWFSLYASLSSNVELFRAPFALWWTDLSSPDPYFTLPLALGVLMFVQQKISPATGVDPMQQKMMLYLMPTMITSFMLFLPAGLCLYMLTNSALSIGQQRLIEVRLKAAGSGNQGATPTTSSPTATPQPSNLQQATDQPAASAALPMLASSSQSNPRAGRPSKAERRWRRGKR
jgi:YidC/Oxa1 family membrane protein insertase